MSETRRPIFADDECACHGGNPHLHLRREDAYLPGEVIPLAPLGSHGGTDG